MQPLKLTLTGFKGIQAGMGLQSYTLDLEKAADGAQLVAIVGKNGRGKTTILDNLQPYRVMPSKMDKSTTYSPDAFSYFDHLVRPGDASKELIWSHRGVTYRSLLEWKITEKTQATNAYLQRLNESGAWEPVTLPDGTSSDGKAKTYDRCVEGVLGSPRLFFTAAFSAQGRTQLSGYGQGDIKALMSEVLGLDTIQALGDKAGKVVASLRDRLKGCREILDGLAEKEQRAGILRQQIHEDRQHVANYERQEAEFRDRVKLEQASILEMEREQQDAEVLRIRRQDVQKQIDTASEQKSRALAEVRKDIDAVSAQQISADQKLAEEITRLEATKARALDRAASARLVLAERDAIEQAAASLPALRAAVQETDQAVTVAREKVQQLKLVESSQASLNERIKLAMDAGRRARETHDDLVQRCALTKEVPCQGTDLQGRCKLLSGAVEAESKLPEVAADLEAQRAAYDELVAERDGLAEKLKELPALEADLAAAVQAHQKAGQELTAAERLAAKEEGLARAEQDLIYAEESIAEADDKIASTRTERDHLSSTTQARIDELKQREADTDQSYSASIARLNDELSRIPVPGDDGALQQARQRLATAEHGEQEARDSLEKTRGAIAHNEGQLQAMEADLAAAAAVTRQQEHLESEISHWSTLQKALGRDGILALSIDDAGPTLSSLANELLTSCYGPRFTVRIDTQAQVKTTGQAKETFDITVFDAQADASKSVRDMSGGEKIWINEAMTRAIALYQAQTAGNTFDTLFSDESDGALDQEKKEQFVRMKRRVIEIGGYQREFFISHSPDVWPLADTVIHIGEPAQEQAA